jgi:hypothetical protein
VETIIVSAFIVVGAAGCACVVFGWLERQDRRWQKALSELRAPEAGVQVFGEWREVGNDCDE